ncbi:Uncharacterised protein [Bordetella pertussis]|nr:Uncharacterised protein [Bordetella pertussis]
MHFQDPARHASVVGYPRRRQLAFVHHVDRLLAHQHLVAHAVVVLDHVERNIQPQHARRLQYQVTHAQLDRYLGQARAQVAVEPLPRVVGHQPALLVGSRFGLRGCAAFGDGLISGGAHLPRIPLSALSIFFAGLPDAPSPPVSASLSCFSRPRLSASPATSRHCSV